MTLILLVDDEPELLEAWSFALEYVGYSVDRARDGREALEQLSRRRPDLVITDLMMPGMNGEDLCRSIRQHAQWAGIPIALHTSAHVGTPVDERLWDSVLRKPARLEVFLATIENLIQG
ncbi:response regulator [Paraburkholderia sp. BCC1886]|uniref:response regulator n=1 Tax=Paraburkholderia sp. BCC1886 TaxID=2562670 RepID=UPI0011838226|nr:response regulator [Paraburkholderia sp. BCC1886]